MRYMAWFVSRVFYARHFSLVYSFCFGIMYVEIDLFSFHSPAMYTATHTVTHYIAEVDPHTQARSPALYRLEH